MSAVVTVLPRPGASRLWRADGALALGRLAWRRKWRGVSAADSDPGVVRIIGVLMMLNGE